MRILFVIPEMGPGGAERVVADLAGGLVEHDHEVALAAAEGPSDALVEALPLRRVPIAGHGRSLGSFIASTRAVRSLVGNWHPDLVHAINVKASGISALARLTSRGTRFPILASFQGIAAEDYRAATLILRSADLVVCASRQLQTTLAAKGFPETRVVVVPNAVALPEPVSRLVADSLKDEFQLGGGQVVANVGRLVPQKDHHLFLEVARHIHQQREDVRFLVVGDGPLRNELERRARAMGLASAVTFTGLRGDARDLVACSDLVLFTSKWEGLSLAALETLAAGTPLVTTAAEGMHELLSDGVGEIVTSRDPVELADRVIACLDDPDRRRKMSQLGRERVAAEYSLDRMIDRYLRHYSQLTGAPA
jgi:glycosyltransferase involved in cell wall biosynthesis